MSQAVRTAPVRIGVAGALGRMGRAIAAMAGARGGVVLGPLFDRPDLAGQTVDGDRALTSPRPPSTRSDVIIDFSTPEASLGLAKACAANGGPALVIGATGFSKGETRAVEAAAKLIPVVYSGNFSLGVNLLVGLVAHAAAALEAADFDIEVLEAHHRRKVDAPSGTALMLGRAAAAGRGVDLAQVAVSAAATASPAPGRAGRSALPPCAAAASSASTASSSPLTTRSSPCPIRPATAACSPGARSRPPSGWWAARPASMTCRTC